MNRDGCKIGYFGYEESDRGLVIINATAVEEQVYGCWI